MAIEIVLVFSSRCVIKFEILRWMCFFLVTSISCKQCEEGSVSMWCGKRSLRKNCDDYLCFLNFTKRSNNYIVAFTIDWDLFVAVSKRLLFYDMKVPQPRIQVCPRDRLQAQMLYRMYLPILLRITLKRSIWQISDQLVSGNEVSSYGKTKSKFVQRYTQNNTKFSVGRMCRMTFIWDAWSTSSDI